MESALEYSRWQKKTKKHRSFLDAACMDPGKCLPGNTIVIKNVDHLILAYVRTHVGCEKTTTFSLLLPTSPLALLTLTTFIPTSSPLKRTGIDFLRFFPPPAKRTKAEMRVELELELEPDLQWASMGLLPNLAGVFFPSCNQL